MNGRRLGRLREADGRCLGKQCTTRAEQLAQSWVGARQTRSSTISDSEGYIRIPEDEIEAIHRNRSLLFQTHFQMLVLSKPC